mgnify:CR=1 FL=1
MKPTFTLTAAAILVATSLSACNGDNSAKNELKPAKVVEKALTAQDAEQFLTATAKEMLQLNLEGSRAAWINANFITEDTSALAADADQKSTEAGVRFAMAAAKFDHVEVSADQRRKLNILKQSLPTTKSQIQRARRLMAKGFMDCCGFVLNEEGKLVGEVQDKGDCKVCR